MITFEVREVSGNGFLDDPVVAAYQNVDDAGLEDIKALYGPRHIGGFEEFLPLEGINGVEPITEQALAALQPCWQGEVLPMGTIYGVIEDWGDEADSNQVSSSGLATAPARVITAVRNQFTAANPTAASSGSVWASDTIQAQRVRALEQAALRL